MRTVSQKVLRGNTPDHVRVALEVVHRRAEFDLSVPKLLYHSTEGLTGAVDGTVIAGNNRFTAGLVSDDDQLSERYAGIRTRYENRRLGTDRVRFASILRATTSNGTVDRDRPGEEGSLPGIYRSRQSFEPLVTIAVTRELTFAFGAGFQRFDTQVPAARTQSANAAITTLRYERQFEGWGADQQDLEAGYSLRAATKALDSDFAYARHRWELRYSVKRGKRTVIDEAVAGLITGRAPLIRALRCLELVPCCGVGISMISIH